MLFATSFSNADSLADNFVEISPKNPVMTCSAERTKLMAVLALADKSATYPDKLSMNADT